MDRGRLGSRGGQAGPALDAPALVAHCQAHLAGFKVPKHVFFCAALPKNPSGKILKRELRQQYQSAEAARAEQTFGVLPRPEQIAPDERGKVAAL